MKKQRILSALLTLCLVFSLLPTAMAVDADSFTDVGKDSWCYDYVDYVTSKSYFLGTTDTTFSPDRNMTRAMFVVVLARFDGVKVDNSRSSFTDVEPGAWCAGAIEWASDEEIVTGYADGTFKPNAPITRAQMCAIMDRYLDYYTAKHKVTVAQKGTAAKLSDQDQVPAYATTAVKNCQKYGLIYGYEDGTFRPQANSTRAHVAAIIYRLAFLIADAKPVKTNGGSSGGGGGGSSNSHKDTYKITYDMNYAGAPKQRTEYTEATKAAEKPFKTLGAQTRDGYVFTSWNTKADGSGIPYGAGCDYTATGNMTLYAQWLKADDYIGVAVSAAMMQLNEDYINSARLIYGDNAAVLVPVTFNGSETDDAAVSREQTLNARVSVTDSAVAEIVTLASSVACGLVDVTREDLPSKDDVKDMVQDIIDAIEEATGLVISKETTIAEIQDQVYQLLLDESKGLWANFYDENGDYYCGNITVTAGSYNAVIKVDQANHATTLNGSKREAVKKVAAYIARELYASLREASDGGYINEATLTATVDVTFADNNGSAYGAATAKYPHAYPVTVNLLLQGNDLVEYKFDEKSYVKLNVTGNIQTAYEEGVESVAEAVKDSERLSNMLRPIVTETLEKDQTYSDLAAQLEETYGIELEASEEDVKAALLAQVDNWLDANLEVFYDYLWVQGGSIEEMDIAGLCDNSMLADAIWGEIEGQFTEENMGEWLQALIDEELEKADIDLVELVNESDVIAQAQEALSAFADITFDPEWFSLDIESVEDINRLIGIPGDVSFAGKVGGFTMQAKLENFGPALKDEILEEAAATLDERFADSSHADLYEEFISKDADVKNYLIYSALVEMGLDFDDDKNAIESTAQAKLSGVVAEFAEEYVSEKIGAKVENAINDAVSEGGDLESYVDYLSKAQNLKTYEGLAQARFGNLATLLRSDLLEKAIGGRGDSYVDSYLGKAIGKLPEGAGITIDGVEIDKDALADLADAETTVEACKALADILDQFAELSIDSFGEPGIPVKVTYNSRNFEFNLVIAEG